MALSTSSARRPVVLRRRERNPDCSSLLAIDQLDPASPPAWTRRHWNSARRQRSGRSRLRSRDDAPSSCTFRAVQEVEGVR